MKKSFLKKALVMAGAALLALPLALGTSNTVQADETDTATQHVILTKYGFDKDADVTDRATDQQWDGDGAKTLDGVTFQIYDVTANYWSAPKDYKGAFDADKLVDTKTTGDSDETSGKGMLAIDLPTLSTDANGVKRTAVYLFHETNPRAGYNTTADFWLTVDKPAEDGNVYVYPKNEQKTTFSRTFIKKDSATNEVLPGAGFVITDKDGKYLQITDKDGKKVENQNGFVDVLAHNYRITFVEAKDDATTFTSDDKGEFGLNGFEDDTVEYTAIETVVPDGYKAAEDTVFNADNKTTDIMDNPVGILPHTGGAGIVLFVVLGAALIALGGFAYNKRRASF